MKKKNTFIRVLALSLCAIVLCLSLVSCAGSDKVKSGFGEIWEGTKEGAQDIYNKVTDDSTGDVDFQFNNGVNISLCSSEIVRYDEYVAQMITAKVFPYGVDQSVNWDIYWITRPEDATNDLDYYVDISPDKSPNDPNCWIQVNHFAFGAKIGVKATTLVGGFEAECVVSMQGVPTKSELVWESGSDSGSFTQNNETDNLVGFQTAIEFNLFCENNPDGMVVGDQYSDFEFTFDGVDGELTLLRNGTPYTFTEVADNEDIMYNLTHSGFLDWTINGNRIVLNLFLHDGFIFNSIEYSQDGGLSFDTQDFMYAEGSDISDLNFRFTVTEKVSGTSQSFVVHFANCEFGPLSVSLDTTEITL